MASRRDSAAVRPAAPGSDKPGSDEPGITEGGKGRPTPRRKDVEAGRRGRTRLQASGGKEDRQARRRRRETQRLAVLAGDENALAERDRGPIRRFVRDYVDGRRSPGEYFMYMAFGVLGLTFVASQVSQIIGLLAMIAVTIAIVVDSFLLRRRLRAKLAEKFPTADTTGAISYGILRSFQVRRLRLPPPKVAPRPLRKRSKPSASEPNVPVKK